MVLLYRTVYADVADWIGRELVEEQTHGTCMAETLRGPPDTIATLLINYTPV